MVQLYMNGRNVPLPHHLGEDTFLKEMFLHGLGSSIIMIIIY